MGEGLGRPAPPANGFRPRRFHRSGVLSERFLAADGRAGHVDTARRAAPTASSPRVDPTTGPTQGARGEVRTHATIFTAGTVGPTRPIRRRAAEMGASACLELAQLPDWEIGRTQIRAASGAASAGVFVVSMTRDQARLGLVVKRPGVARRRGGVKWLSCMASCQKKRRRRVGHRRPSLVPHRLPNAERAWHCINRRSRQRSKSRSRPMSPVDSEQPTGAACRGVCLP